MRPILLMLKGLPASGKTTFARNMLRIGRWTRVNYDDTREFLGGSESKVKRVSIEKAESSLDSGSSVLWDNTSLSPEDEAMLRDLAKKHDARFRIKFFNMDPAEAVRRDANRLASVGAEAIYSMFNRFLR